MTQNSDVDAKLIFQMKYECYKKFFLFLEQNHNDSLEKIEKLKQEFNNLEIEYNALQKGQKKYLIFY
jgi:hypothetical protein